MLGEHVQHLLVVFAAYFVVIASPGPSTMAIMGVAMKQGRESAVLLALGVVTGSLFWAVCAATGVATMLTAYAEAIFFIKLAGGLYLLYLAWKSARSAMSPRAVGMKSMEPARKVIFYRRGVLLHLSNPKAVLGWVAIMALGLGHDAPSHVLITIVAGCAVLGLTVNVGYALLFSTDVLGRAYQKFSQWIEGALAVVFGYAGFRLLFSRS
ncbi:LysE family translocator [Nitratireductor kimnyeongensis]|uniref:LysE family translocator n=1 Tax=Nitratireductor kimnyeongensis TaxID=430679 RepID=A0ABW0T7S2_9HYPH|nr:LysE family translocator [Nitratireductor kimnyeongensis]QZZ36289.1 LysE family translocator [Nitratireductor kimnyeongensis]